MIGILIVRPFKGGCLLMMGLHEENHNVTSSAINQSGTSQKAIYRFWGSLQYG